MINDFDRWVEEITKLDSRFSPLMDKVNFKAERSAFYCEYFIRGMSPAGALRVYTYSCGNGGL
jgi:hypothetical protein